jgi:hypothetical protein
MKMHASAAMLVFEYPLRTLVFNADHTSLRQVIVEDDVCGIPLATDIGESARCA